MYNIIIYFVGIHFSDNERSNYNHTFVADMI